MTTESPQRRVVWASDRSARRGEAEIQHALRLIHARHELPEHTERPERMGRTWRRPAVQRGAIRRQMEVSAR